MSEPREPAEARTNADAAAAPGPPTAGEMFEILERARGRVDDLASFRAHLLLSSISMGIFTHDRKVRLTEGVACGG